jgi:hypothetical protein
MRMRPARKAMPISLKDLSTFSVSPPIFIETLSGSSFFAIALLNAEEISMGVTPPAV